MRHREATGEDSLCLAGGVALNSLANAALESQAGFRRIFVQPAAGNAGAAPGVIDATIDAIADRLGDERARSVRLLWARVRGK